MILKADHVKIKFPWDPRVGRGDATISDDLSENILVGALMRGELNPCLDIKAVSKPLAFRQFVVVAHQLFGDGNGLGHQLEFLAVEMVSLHGLLEKNVDKMGVMMLNSVFMYHHVLAKR